MLHLNADDVSYMTDVVVHKLLERCGRQTLVLDLSALLLRLRGRHRLIVEVRIIRTLGQRSTP